MKHTILALALTILLHTHPAQAAEWHIAPHGDDTAPGTLEQPFATLQRTQQTVQPGDTVLIHGGTYHLTDAHISKPHPTAAFTRRIFATITHLTKSGERGKPITYRPYQDEKPIFDCTQVTPPGKRVTAFYITGSWLHLKGITVTGVQVTIKTHTQSIAFESNGSHNILEQLTIHDTQAIGIYHTRGSHNLFLNCDAWNNWDHTSEDKKGGNVDGFGCHPDRGSIDNTFRGCRAWNNSDDGFDLINAHEPVTIEHCWAINNGLTPTQQPAADGNGFKAGGYAATPANRLPTPIPRHTIRYNLAVGNKASGFYANHHPGGNQWNNNSAYRNKANYNLLNRTPDNTTDTPGYNHTLHNNLGHRTKAPLINLDPAKSDLKNNTLTGLTDQHFQSLDETQLLQPRQPDGSLPNTTFLHLLKQPTETPIGAFP